MAALKQAALLACNQFECKLIIETEVDCFQRLRFLWWTATDLRLQVDHGNGSGLLPVAAFFVQCLRSLVNARHAAEFYFQDWGYHALRFDASKSLSVFSLAESIRFISPLRVFLPVLASTPSQPKEQEQVRCIRRNRVICKKVALLSSTLGAQSEN